MNNMDFENNDIINNLKNMMGEDQVNDAISKISSSFNNTSSDFGNNSFNFDDNSSGFGDIDMATLMKMKDILSKLKNNNGDPRSNLLKSLKPYMRDSRKENLDKYAKLLKMADLASLLNNEDENKKENYYDE